MVNGNFVRLGEISEAIRGVTFSGGEAMPEAFDNSLACLTTSGVQEVVNWDSRRFIPKKRLGNSKQLLQEGDILISTANSKELVGKSCIVERLPYAVTFGAFVTVIRPNKKVLPDYVGYWMKTREFLDKCYLMSSNTTNISNLRISELLEFQLPLPPLSEQKRIASLLARADRLRSLRRTGRALGESLLQSVFLEMFGEPKVNPKKWDMCIIDDVVEFSQYGTSEKSNSEKCGYPVLGMANITYEGKIDLEKLSYVELSEKEFAELKLERGDVIFNRTNSTELVGKTALWNYDFGAVIASYLVKLKLKKEVLPEFFVGLLNSPHFKSMFQERCKKAVGQSNISPTLLKEFPMFIPPLVLQEEFAAIASGRSGAPPVPNIEGLRGRMSEAERQGEGLFESLLAESFA